MRVGSPVTQALPSSQPGAADAATALPVRARTGLEIATEQAPARTTNTAPPRAADVSALAERAKATFADVLPARMLKRAEELGDAPAYYVKVGKTWSATSWKDYARQVRDVAKALIALGVKDGEVATIFANNSPEWAIADLGLMTVGAASAGAFPDLGPSAVAHVVSDSESRVVFVQDAAALASIQTQLDANANVQHVVVMKGPAPQHPKAMTWAELTARGATVPDADVDARLAAVKPSQLATLIYTSGTTGLPKGAMLSHTNLAFAGDVMKSWGSLTPRDTGVCYLKLGHIADRNFSIAGPMTTGMAVYHSSPTQIARDLPSIKPTVYFGVPRVYDAISAKVENGLAEKTKAKGVRGLLAKVLLPLLTWIGMRASALRNKGGAPSGIAYRFAERKLFAPIKQLAGLENARIRITGAAALAPSTQRTFERIGAPLQDAYGQSETTGIITANKPGDNVPGSIGKPPPGVTVKLAEDGEILVRGPNIFMGYWKNQEATAEVIKDGWLHTGDIGRMDAAGNLYYVCRKKRSFKVQSGEWVNPEPIELALRGGIIADAVVVGRERKQIGAAIILEPLAVKALAQKHGFAEAEAHKRPEVLAAVDAELARANKSLEGFLKIRKYFVVDRPLSNAPDGEIGPTGKLKPFAFEANFAAPIDALLGKAGS